MKAYMFRFLREGKPTGYGGVVVCKRRNLFAEIERHGDPHNCQIRRYRGQFSCAHYFEGPLRPGFAFSCEGSFSDDNWQAPPWAAQSTDSDL